MKRKIIYFLPLLLLSITGCLKSNSDPSNVVIPTGTFAGQFTRVHLHPATGKLDTIKANLTLTMSTTAGYAISGDTTLHAASHGGYAVDGLNIAFSDQTLPASPNNTTPVPTKVHLNGVYSYAYNGSALQIAFSSDTLAFFYNFTAKP